MGFWHKVGDVGFKTVKFLGSAATVVGNNIEKQAGEIKELKEKYESKSDAELVKIAEDSGFLGSSSTEKGVARRVLRERNHGISGGT